MKNIAKAGTQMLSSAIGAQETDMNAKQTQKDEISNIAGDLIGNLKPLTKELPGPFDAIAGGLADFASGFFPLNGDVTSHVNRDGHS